MLMISVPSGSTVGIEIMPILTSGSVSRFRDQNVAASTGNTAAKELFTLAVRVGSESVDAAADETSEWKWTQSFQGRSPYVQLHNSNCSHWSRYYLGLYSENANSATKVGVVLSQKKINSVCNPNAH